MRNSNYFNIVQISSYFNTVRISSYFNTVRISCYIISKYLVGFYRILSAVEATGGGQGCGGGVGGGGGGGLRGDGLGGGVTQTPHWGSKTSPPVVERWEVSRERRTIGIGNAMVFVCVVRGVKMSIYSGLLPKAAVVKNSLC